MKYVFAPLISQIDSVPRCIKPELFFQVSALINEIFHDDTPLAPQIASAARALMQGAENQIGIHNQYAGLGAFLESSHFSAMATGVDQQASQIAFRQLLRVLEAILDQHPTLTDNRSAQITSLLDRTDIHRNN